jgi:hypothetical protein
VEQPAAGRGVDAAVVCVTPPTKTASWPRSGPICRPGRSPLPSRPPDVAALWQHRDRTAHMVTDTTFARVRYAGPAHGNCARA